MKKNTQRRITIVRHAKAMPDEPEGGDHARALNSRGREDAAALGAWLEKHHTLPDVVLCSTATRTRETLGLLNLEVPVVLTERLYLASAGDMLTLLQEEDDANQHVMILGHNPGLHALVIGLAKDYASDGDADALTMKFPTSALASMTIDIASWRELAPQSATVDAVRVSHKND